MINGQGGTRDSLGRGLFHWLLVEDPYGPRFPEALVAGADRFEQRASPNADWPEGEWFEFLLFAGQEPLVERRLIRKRGEQSHIEERHF